MFVKTLSRTLHDEYKAHGIDVQAHVLGAVASNSQQEATESRRCGVVVVGLHGGLELVRP